MADADSDMTESRGGSESSDSQLPIILSFVADWPNIVTLLGLCSGVLAIFFALEQNYPAAIIAMLWAVLFDCMGIAQDPPERAISMLGSTVVSVTKRSNFLRSTAKR